MLFYNPEGLCDFDGYSVALTGVMNFTNLMY